MFFGDGFFISFTEIFKVFNHIYISGLSPICIIGIATVANVDAGMITSSLFFKLKIFLIAFKAIKFVDDPELVAIPFAIINIRKIFQNF